MSILQAARLVDSEGRWSGGTAVLVQLGDVPDRGPHTLKIIRHMMKLQREAKRARGRVVALVGNHEAMNMTGDLRYVHPGEFAAFVDADSGRRREAAYRANSEAIHARYRAEFPNISAEDAKQRWFSETPLGWIEHRRAWSPQGEIGRWVSGNPAVALIGNNLFLHGGLSSTYGAIPLTVINQRVAAALKAQEVAPDAIINDPAGPLWYRGLLGAGAETELAAVLASQGAARVVIGHTPRPEGIQLLYDGRLVQADTGISAAYGGSWTYVEIVGDRVMPRTVRQRQRNAGGGSFE